MGFLGEVCVIQTSERVQKGSEGVPKRRPKGLLNPPLQNNLKRTVNIFIMHRNNKFSGVLENIVNYQIVIIKNDGLNQLQNRISLNINREPFAQILFILVG